MGKLGKSAHARVLLASLAIQAAVGYADYTTGFELNLDVLYFVPISICAWYLSRNEVITSAIIGALTWGYADIRSGHHYTSQAYLYWNIFVRLGSLTILGLLVKGLRDNIRKQALARRELEKTLADLRQSAEEIQKLQSQLQVVCAWTKRIRVEGKWMTFEEFLKNHLHFKLSHSISPEAVDQFAREIEGTKKPEAPGGQK